MLTTQQITTWLDGYRRLTEHIQQGASDYSSIIRNALAHQVHRDLQHRFLSNLCNSTASRARKLRELRTFDVFNINTVRAIAELYNTQPADADLPPHVVEAQMHLEDLAPSLHVDMDGTLVFACPAQDLTLDRITRTLGPWEIRLRLSSRSLVVEGRGTVGCSWAYDAPYVHPNIGGVQRNSDGSSTWSNLCLGDIRDNVTEWFNRGDLTQIFMRCRQILYTVSDLTPYFSLRNWDGREFECSHCHEGVFERSIVRDAQDRPYHTLCYEELNAPPEPEPEELLTPIPVPVPVPQSVTADATTTGPLDIRYTANAEVIPPTRLTSERLTTMSTPRVLAYVLVGFSGLSDIDIGQSVHDFIYRDCDYDPRHTLVEFVGEEQFTDLIADISEAISNGDIQVRMPANMFDDPPSMGRLFMLHEFLLTTDSIEFLRHPHSGLRIYQYLNNESETPPWSQE